ncbi:helix-turn-helix domain-containing protein [Actinoplanes rectilineatus]|uniref:helix-turn-helix domain-containing protein n=1 Tax=Actinoplanes rectilineatus TaxID=113571 RepID=UPI0009F9618A|nr:helix-turn-helix transcriptional regulator [Actinoplanes rectilineatus]
MTALSWTTNPAILQASRAGEYATILRSARAAAGLTLEQLSAASGYSASTLSRLENRRRPIRDEAELRNLADLYGVPLRLFGLPAPSAMSPRSNLAKTVDRGGDDVQRRNFLAGAAVAGVSAVLPGSSPADATPAGHSIPDVLFGRVVAEPLPGRQLAAQLAAARGDYRAARYSRLARRLPRLLAQAHAGRDAAGLSEIAAASDQLSEAYVVAAQLLLKLHDDSLACVAADRAQRAAGTGTDPLMMAESRRLAATVLRRAGHGDSAQQLVLAAAARLRDDVPRRDAATRAAYGRMLAVAAYTAAVRDDRDAAWELLAEAGQAAAVAGGAAAFNGTEVAVYRISVARKLGDYGAAVDFARRVDPRSIADAERQARYWEDTALALHGRGRPYEAFTALRSAEQDAPEEVRCRPWAQQLTRDLLSSPAARGMSGLRDFAVRTGVV